MGFHLYPNVAMNDSLRRMVVVFGMMMLAGMAQDQTLAPEQLDSMVAPIALYPDSLLSQVLVASTYPLELVEAQQFLQQNSTLTGTALVDAAKQQNWDPSIQALVPFQDVIQRLTSDIRWTTDLGNAFLAQQADVMSAVQRMRARAKDSGKLTDTPQQKVVVEDQDGQSAIEIQPTDPQVVYVPVYDPGYFWGPPPPLYPWPGLYYPGIGVGWGWGPGIHLGFYFGGCCGWGGWGWGPGWFNHTVIVNNNFFHRYNYQEFHGGGEFRGSAVWAHDAGHRGAVPYSNPGVAQRYQGGGNNFRGAQRPSPDAVRSNFSRSNPSQAGRVSQPVQDHSNNHSAFGGVGNGNQARQQSDHGFSSLGSQRSAPAPSRGGGGGGGRPAGGGGGGSRGRGR
jgi:Protein of unknown function (DUF3300)